MGAAWCGLVSVGVVQGHEARGREERKMEGGSEGTLANIEPRRCRGLPYVEREGKDTCSIGCFKSWYRGASIMS